MVNDLIYIFYWWLIVFIFGLVSLPFLSMVFGKFWDKGWVFGKTISIVLVSYSVFVLGRTRVLPFGRLSIVLVLVLGFVGIWYWKEKQPKEFNKFFSHWKVFLGQELMFLATLSFWSIIRGFQPDIEGLEKFMDCGFVNSILRSKWFPPKDMWFAGESINYYYFGHLQAAVLTKFSGLSTAYTYNLMLATLFGLVFTSSFSLVSNFINWVSRKKKIITKYAVVGGIIASLLISLGGNLHTLTYVIKKGAKKYWYPDATRFIGYTPDNPDDATIHEFPAYSFVVADLHGHLNDLPTVLLFLAVLFVFGARIIDSKASFSLQIKKIVPGLSFLLAAMYMTNSWDFPIYGVLFALFVFLINLFTKKKIKKAVTNTFVLGIVVLVGSIIFALPFALTFEPMTQGIGFVNAHTLWWQFLVLWGFFWLVSLSFWLFLGPKKRGKNWWDLADLLVLAMTIWATILIFIPELIYVKDIYVAEYHRANTMFKLVYQSFVMYCLSLGYIVVRVKSYLKKRNLYFAVGYLFVFMIGFAAQMIYPYFSIKGYYHGLEKYKGLYGLNFLKEKHPGNYQAVKWLNRKVDNQPVILEAVGDSYTVYNHLSALTGLPTVEGWLVHEWLWRGGYDQPGKRDQEVKQIYQGDKKRAKQLLQNYEVEYVLVGPLEKEKYPDIDKMRFEKWGKRVFSSEETMLYKIEL